MATPECFWLKSVKRRPEGPSFRAEQDRRAEQQDQLHRASLPTGIPAAMVPDGLTPAQAMMLADKSSGPQAKSVHEQLLERELGSGESMVFHSFGPNEE